MYEIRRGRTVVCRSSLPGCGYDSKTLKDMARAGLVLYCNGQKEKAANRR